MKVVLLYNRPADSAASDERDVLDQRDAVAAALGAMGQEVHSLGCTLDFDSLERRLRQMRPDVVFNLVESLGGTDRLSVLVPMLLDALAIPYTGARTDAILASANKVVAKDRLRHAGLPTPDWFVAGESPARGCSTPGTSAPKTPGRRNTREMWILKPVWEHASFGMDDDAVVAVPDVRTLESLLLHRERRLGRPHFAERFVEGREFNLSILAGRTLPPAEIDFSDLPVDRPRIVGYLSKWAPESDEYRQTLPRSNFPRTDVPLLDRLAQLAHRCWRLFGSNGYARVDFRVDEFGEPWILEVNTNPCLSPDAGFAAALARAGITFEDAVQSIIADALPAASAAPASLAASDRFADSGSSS